MDFPTFITHINDSLAHENGIGLAYLLRPTSPHGRELVKQYRNLSRPALRRYEGCIASPWDEIAILYVLICGHIHKRRSPEAFRDQVLLVNNFLRYFVENQGWTLQALFAILRDLRDLAIDADIQARAEGGKADHMEEAARVIMKAFTHCVTDRSSPPDRSRKWGVYYVAGLVFKCYFRLKRISLTKNILRALEVNQDIPSLDAYPRAHRVTFRYYLGMLNFLNEEYAKAEEQLTLAFYNCYTGHHANQERILAYLIPLRVLKGHLPSKGLLARFPILEALYTPFVESIRKGDIATFDSALEANEQRLLALNLFLTVERSRELCMRSLFRKAWVAADRTTRMPISMFHAALRISGSDVPVEEAECFVANMIYKGFMKGYISHGMQMVVLSKANAFPRLVERPSPFSVL
ncbi:hypothetical protein BD626DRAFT_545149 [Schizophyllum amplum]|uniref:PCI domain-containing protein n=1 Tax=Schizophyllum amplum TaxID=97359 RepID=A0A550CSS6_9AGAR|nr:hypothetical protein BD626DRAFT_545149 [Auriculariopsis ampla]